MSKNKPARTATLPNGYIFGRPTDYRPEFCSYVVELGRKGKSKAVIARELNCTPLTIDTWTTKHPDFLNAMRQANALSLAWWEEQGQLGIWEKPGDPKFNANAYRLQVMNRFPDAWRDRQETNYTGKVTFEWKDEASPKIIEHEQRVIEDKGDKD